MSPASLVLLSIQEQPGFSPAKMPSSPNTTARTEAGESRLTRNAELHHRLGAPTRLLSGAEALEIVPQLDVSDVRLAAFNPEDGVVFPWPFVWGYAGQAVSRGVTVRTHTAVDRIEGLADGLRLHLSTGERLDAEVLTADRAWGTVGRIRQIR